MELKDLLILYRRWIWLLILGMILGLIGGHLASKIQTPVYEASAKVLVAKSRQQGGTDILGISDQQLIVTYQQLLKTRPVIEEVESRLDVNIDPENIQVNIIPDSQIIQIKVQDTNPRQTSAIASTLVEILIEHNETLYTGRYTAYEEGLNSQIAQVEKQISILQREITQINQTHVEEQLQLVDRQITDLQSQVTDLENEIAQFPSILSTVDRVNLVAKQNQLIPLRSRLSLYQEIEANLTFIGKPGQGGTGPDDVRITSLESTLNLYQQLYLSLLNSLTEAKLTRVQSTPTVSQIDHAVIPEKPVRPIPVLYTALAGILGLAIAAAAVLLIDYFDDTFRSTQKIEEVLDVPVLGAIAEVKQTRKVHGNYSIHQMEPLLLNSFGILRINVSRLVKRKALKTILVTSPALGDGKTTIATNLAAAFAQAGKKVVLVDGDLYHPALHSRFGIEDQKGLSDILAQNLDWRAVAHDFGEIAVITGGSPSLYPTGLLESDGMTQLLDQLQNKADVVIIDGPPLSVVDSQIIASKVGGILIVIRQGETLTTMARALLNQIRLIEVNVLGVVLNRVPRAGVYYGEYYRDVSKEKKVEMLGKVNATQD